ncbi:MAG: deoxyribonuclease IV [Methanomicrobiaceae archaeon]|nr:deoxyribonuclease IV [Methanomicrobiaceae archaeon]
MNVKVGCHVSIAGSIDKAVNRAEEIGCDTFQVFTGNPRGWNVKPLEEDATDKFREKVAASGINPVVAHMPYLPNPASPKNELYEKSCDVLLRELRRCETLGIPYLVTHPGSHLGSGRDRGIERIAGAIDSALDSDSGKTCILVENTSGSKNSIGGSIGDIADILDRLSGAGKKRTGVCFDTCHAWAAGYDLSTKEGLDETLEAFDSLIGLEKLKIIHLNDSKGELDGHLDRHEHIGLGRIGEDGMRNIVTDKRLSHLPFICETPVNDIRDDAGNLAKVRELSA